MNSYKSKPILCFFLLICFGFFDIVAQNYPTAKELNLQFENIAKSNPGKVKIHQLTISPGENQLIVTEIGLETSKTDKKNPAIFVLANPDGLNPLASYASINLAKLILKEDKNLKYTWFILPVLNPDAMAIFFSKVKWENPRNGQKINDDQDDAIDEDGPDDLNNDGFITQMRVKDPLGIWIVDETDKRILRKADPAKGEKGVYSLYQEGIDNDNDGEYNEDPSGGINTGVNFPHLFKSFVPTAGAWPGCTPEVFDLMKFIFAHPEIAATFVFGNTNFCLVPPESGRKGRTDSISSTGQTEIPGPITKTLSEDFSWYKELSEQYKEFLKTSKFDMERLDPDKPKDCSFEFWSYFQLGVPSFSFNFFTLPKPKEAKKNTSGITLEKFEGMAVEEFIALGEEKIEAFLKENNIEEQFKVQSLIEKLKSGQNTIKQIAEMVKNAPKAKKPADSDPELKALLAFSDTKLGGKGYIGWQPYKHPTLGDVEIGGTVPFTSDIPPFAWADSLINLQLPWIFTLADKLPQLKIVDYKVKSLGSNVYQIEIWVENTKYLPFPTEMGKKDDNPGPCVLTLVADSMEFLSGYKRTPIRAIGGLKDVKRTYIVKLNKGKTIKVLLESKSAGNDSKEIKL